MGKSFRVMTKEERSRYASMGGKAAHAKGVAHKFTSEEARKAGILGGRACQARRRAAKKLDTTPCPPPEMAVTIGDE